LGPRWNDHTFLIVSGEALEISTTSARQGITCHNVRYVLGYGTLAIVIAFFFVYLFFSAS